ncbi:hypothetical protein AB0D27_14010 [Streptomyces sp. NPDC048415]|jgi:type 1 glutamine amidotransferase|uniref:hypothetical protein n=1 Tax=Streptomyces sp. NPDC048415 TaxID=3154822 RepID=UPI0034490F80
MVRIPAPHRIGEPEGDVEGVVDSLPAELVDRLSSFLESGEPLLFSPGTIPDAFSESSEMRVRIGIMTDGEWVWHLAWADYVQYHRVSPPDAFIQHIQALNYTAAEISMERAMEIAEAEGIPMPD